MSWIEVDSTWINALNYFDDEEALEINLLDGKTYIYFGVPKKLFQQFVEADSKGRFYNDHIKHNYNSLRVSPAEPLEYPVFGLFRFYATPGAENTSANGILQGSKISNVVGFDDLAALPANISSGWNELFVANQEQYKYLRVYFPAVADQYSGQLREIEFRTQGGAMIEKVSIFSDGWYNQPDEDNGAGKLFDGDILTASASAFGSFVYFGIEVAPLA